MTAVAPLRGLEQALRSWADRQLAALQLAGTSPLTEHQTLLAAHLAQGQAGLQERVASPGQTQTLVPATTDPAPPIDREAARPGPEVEHFMQTLVRSFRGSEAQAGSFSRALAILIADLQTGPVPAELGSAFEHLPAHFQAPILPPYGLPPGTLMPPPERTSRPRKKKGAASAFADPQEDQRLALLRFLGQLQASLAESAQDSPDKPLGVLVDVAA